MRLLLIISLVCLMSLSKAIGSTLQPTTNTTVQITGIGFPPEVIFFFFNLCTADGGVADSSTGIGIWCRNGGSPTQHSCWIASDDNNTDTVVNNRMTASDCVIITNPAGGILGFADVSATDSDSFTLNWTSVDGTQRVINYMALGGDIRGKSGAQAKPTAAGNQAITGAGAQPTCLLLITGGDDVIALDTNYAPRSGLCLGWATSATARGLSAWGERNARPVGDGCVYQRTTFIGAAMTNFVAGLADLVSLDADGATLNWSIVSVRASYYIWVALWGTDVSFKVGSFTSDTDLGAQVVTGVGFPPEAMIYVSNGKVASNFEQYDDHRYSVGAAISSAARACIWDGGDNGSVTTNESSLLDRDKVMEFAVEGGDSPTKTAEADLTSFDSDGFTWDWTDASPVAAQILYLAIKGAAAAAGSVGPLIDGPLLVGPLVGGRLVR